MDSSTIDRLRALNNQFYADNAQSFSASRNSPWPGWKRVLAHIGKRPALDVLDIACGNLRFERYLADELDEAGASFTCVDSCPELVQAGLACEYVNADVVQMLDDSLPFAEVLVQKRFDLAVSFGFMHHVPGARLRERLLDEMAETVKPGGLMAVSLWRFATLEKLAKKAEQSTLEACQELGLELDEGDYLLGWNDKPNVYRYCHSFSDEEIEGLENHIASRAECIDRYEADGRNNALNGYLVFRKR